MPTPRWAGTLIRSGGKHGVGVLLGVAIALYLKEGKLSHETKRHYSKCLSVLNSYFPSRSIESLTKTDIAEFRGSLSNTSNAHLYRMILAIRSLLRFFSEIYDLEVLDYRKIKKASYVTGHWGYLKENEISRILCHLKTHNTRCSVQMYCAISLMFSTGARVDELVNIKLDQIDLSRKEIHLIVTKTDKPRTVFINKGAEKALLNWLKIKPDSEYLFPSNGAHLTPKAIRFYMERLGQELGIKHCHPHALRKGLAQKLLNDGVDIAYIQKFLGHDKLSTTQNYISIDPEKLRQIHERSFGSQELYFSKKRNGRLVLELRGMSTEKYSVLNKAIQKAIDEIL